jgi:hypothetical protein
VWPAPGAIRAGLRARCCRRPQTNHVRGRGLNRGAKDFGIAPKLGGGVQFGNRGSAGSNPGLRARLRNGHGSPMGAEAVTHITCVAAGWCARMVVGRSHLIGHRCGRHCRGIDTVTAAMSDGGGGRHAGHCLFHGGRGGNAHGSSLPNHQYGNYRLEPRPTTNHVDKGNVGCKAVATVDVPRIGYWASTASRMRNVRLIYKAAGSTDVHRFVCAVLSKVP